MLEKVAWMQNPDIRPYIFMRRENLFPRPGSLHKCEWFTRDILFKDPLKMSEVTFADMILDLEGKAFSKADMKMPRWVFYDCAVVPGFVCGFVQRRSSMDQKLLDVLNPPKDEEWVPISLFIIIPTVRQGRMGGSQSLHSEFADLRKRKSLLCPWFSQQGFWALVCQCRNSLWYDSVGESGHQVALSLWAI